MAFLLIAIGVIVLFWAIAAKEAMMAVFPALFIGTAVALHYLT